MDEKQLLADIGEMARALRLRLEGKVVLTEAANGPYASAPLLAALCGATVIAIGKDSRYGSFKDTEKVIAGFAKKAGLAERIKFTQMITDEELATVDIVTNSGHLRPLGEKIIRGIKPGAAIATMYEAWELRKEDIDLQLCRERKILVAGTNEGVEELGIFQELGNCVLQTLKDAKQTPSAQSVVKIFSDNPFAGPLLKSLQTLFPRAELVNSMKELGNSPIDLLIIATTPPASGGREIHLKTPPTKIACQIWGDVDRSEAKVNTWLPAEPPSPGHMGIPLGFSSIIRLQAGGLKCAQEMLAWGKGDYPAIVQWLVGP